MMELMGTSFQAGALIGGVAGGMAVLVLAMVAPRKKCPKCGEPLPRFRKPASPSQMLWGGWTCGKCGCQMDRYGQMVANK
jgi:hypothetical protein